MASRRVGPRARPCVTCPRLSPAARTRSSRRRAWRARTPSLHRPCRACRPARARPPACGMRAPRRSSRWLERASSPCVASCRRLSRWRRRRPRGPHRRCHSAGCPPRLQRRWPPSAAASLPRPVRWWRARPVASTCARGGAGARAGARGVECQVAAGWTRARADRAHPRAPPRASVLGPAPPARVSRWPPGRRSRCGTSPWSTWRAGAPRASPRRASLARTTSARPSWASAR